MPRPVPNSQTGSLTDNEHGTNDTLILGPGTSPSDLQVVLHGDAFALYDDSRGGNDTLIGGAGSINFLNGDVLFMYDNARGGNDTLISSGGTDHMYGDALLINDVVASPTAPTGSMVTGTDTFVFAPGNGADFVYDLRQSDHDRVDVSAYGFHGLADMTIIDTGADTRIEFDATNSVTLVGFGDPAILQASDFIFA